MSNAGSGLSRGGFPMRSAVSVVRGPHGPAMPNVDGRDAGRRRSLARWASLAPISVLLSGLLLVSAMPTIGSVAANSTPTGAATTGAEPNSGPPSTDWPQFRAGPGHLGYQTETKLGASNVPF